MDVYLVRDHLYNINKDYVNFKLVPLKLDPNLKFLRGRRSNLRHQLLWVDDKKEVTKVFIPKSYTPSFLALLINAPNDESIILSIKFVSKEIEKPQLLLFLE